MLDEDFIPTVTRAAASASLIRILRSIADKLASRADVLANEKAQVRAAGNAALIELMLLRIANAKGAVFAEMAAAGAHHPEAIYRECLALAGELVTFSSAKSTRAPRFDPYDHDNIAMCFAKALACIDDMLAEVVDPDAYKIPLNEWEGYGFHGVVTPPHLLPDGRFIIVAKAALDEETFRKTFVRQTTIASSAQIPDYVAAMDRGLQLRALSSVPSELRAQAGWTYFELGHDQPCWADIVASQAIAIYFAEVFPDLKLELWGIRSGK